MGEDDVYQIDTGNLSEGDAGYGWQYFSDGTAISPTGEYYYQGNLVYSPSDVGGGSSGGSSGGGSDNSIWGRLTKAIGTKTANTIKSAFVNEDGTTNLRGLAGVAGGLYGLYQSRKPQEKTGYQGKIPTLEAVREQVPHSQYDPTRRPGSGGMRYFSDTTYAAPGEAATAARTAAKDQAAGLEALNRENPAKQPRTPTQAAAERGRESERVQERAPASAVAKSLPVPKYATGGITALAKGGEPRYLSGATDGMADKIPARIDGGQEAKLSHGEFVIPADVVGHLGNGNSEAGAQRLYAMMDRIRKARTGSTKQGKQINPDKFLPV